MTIFYSKSISLDTEINGNALVLGLVKVYFVNLFASNNINVNSDRMICLLAKLGRFHWSIASICPKHIVFQLDMWDLWNFLFAFHKLCESFLNKYCAVEKPSGYFLILTLLSICILHSFTAFVFSTLFNWLSGNNTKRTFSIIFVVVAYLAHLYFFNCHETFR